MLCKKNCSKSIIYTTFGIATLAQVNNFNKSLFSIICIKSDYVHKNCA